MFVRRRGFVALVVAVLAAVLLAGMPATVSAKSSSPVVMTRNLYLGADLTAVIGAGDLGELGRAVADSYVNVVATDFPSRAGLVAQEIAATSPDLIGLQEATLWRTGPLGDPAPAEDIVYDYLGLLETELNSLGLAYEVAVVQENFDAEAPATVSSSGVPVLEDVRLTQRTAILVRTGLAYSNVQSELFDTNVTYPDIGGIPGNNLTDPRGWVSIDVILEPKGKTFRFLNTHLESFVAPVRTIQAQELVDGPLSTGLKVIAVGDFNSPPTGPESGAYQILTDTRNGKMRDAWVAANPGQPGYTFGQAPDLANPVSTADTRIDLILTRTAAVKALRAELVGTTPPAPGQLWASDHFGVLAQLQMP